MDGGGLNTDGGQLSLWPPKPHKPSDLKYTSLMSKDTMDLTILSNEALERLANTFGLADDWDNEHLCVMEMGRRGHFPTAWLDDLAMAGF